MSSFSGQSREYDHSYLQTTWRGDPFRWRVLGGSANTMKILDSKRSSWALLTESKGLSVREESSLWRRFGIRWKVGSSPDCGSSAARRGFSHGGEPSSLGAFARGAYCGGAFPTGQGHLHNFRTRSAQPELASENAVIPWQKRLSNFSIPLFEYSPIALGTATTGEENLFKILGMNHAQAIHAFYIAGATTITVQPSARAPTRFRNLKIA